MIIDLILDRKDLEQAGMGNVYEPRRFYYSVLEYRDVTPEDSDRITSAMDSGTEKDVKTALKKYIDDNDYNESIKDYIDSVDWL